MGVRRSTDIFVCVKLFIYCWKGERTNFLVSSLLVVLQQLAVAVAVAAFFLSIRLTKTYDDDERTAIGSGRVPTPSDDDGDGDDVDHERPRDTSGQCLHVEAAEAVLHRGRV